MGQIKKFKDFINESFEDDVNNLDMIVFYHKKTHNKICEFEKFRNKWILYTFEDSKKFIDDICKKTEYEFESHEEYNSNIIQKHIIEKIDELRKYFGIGVR